MNWLDSYIYRTLKYLRDSVIKLKYIQPTVMTIGKDVEGTDHGLIRGNNQAFFCMIWQNARKIAEFCSEGI